MFFDNFKQISIYIQKNCQHKKVKGPMIAINGWVMLNAKNLRFKNDTKKLSPKFLGPFLELRKLLRLYLNSNSPTTKKFIQPSIAPYYTPKR